MDNREIDKLIAEKVMGYRYDSTKRTFFKDIGHGWFNPVFNFHPSEDLLDAWLVVEQLPYDIKVTKYKNSTGYQCHVFIPNNVKMVFEETAPLAICKAVLKAVGVEVT